MKKILVACGTAIATSTVVAKKLEEKLRARGIAVTIDQCKASEVSSKASAYDLVVTTTEVDDARGKPVVRTLLAIHETDQSLTFAGDVPEGSYARMMRTTIPHLIAGAMTGLYTLQGGLEGGEADGRGQGSL